MVVVSLLHLQVKGIQRLVAFLCILSKQNSKPKKQDCMQTYFLLTIGIFVWQLAYIPAYFYFAVIRNMILIMNKIHYIYKYNKLKYGLFIDSLLTAMPY